MKYYLTTPLYYVNAAPHIGHTYTTMAAETIARFKRMQGHDVVLFTGTDEHGQKVERSALAAGKSPEEFTRIVTEENYFFKLSAFTERLLALYENDPQFVQPDSRRNEVLSFVKQGLQDLSISRTTLKWGIPLPVEGNHVFYVWFDALIGYMSAVKDDPGLWPADLHLIGKEILRFHAVFWPAFLMAAGQPLPKRVFAHGWLLFENDKMSKSRGNMLRAEPIRRVVGVDGLRYFLLREIVFGQDGSFSYDALIGRYNSELANGLGNLASRTLTMIQQYRGGVIPASWGDPDGTTAA